MSGSDSGDPKKLRLVTPVVSSPKPDQPGDRPELDGPELDGPELDGPELDAALALRDALDAPDGLDTSEDGLLALALRAAYRGGRSAEADVDHDGLLDQVLSGAERLTVEDEERLEAAKLRQGLLQAPAPESTVSPLVSLAAELRAAHRTEDGAGQDLDELTHERILRNAMRAPLVTASGVSKAGPRLAVWTALGGAAAAAAAVLMVFSAQQSDSEPPAQLAASAGDAAALISSRSAADLFDAAVPFERTGGTSDRVDKIASVRRSELRQNQYARWGVR